MEKKLEIERAGCDPDEGYKAVDESGVQVYLYMYLQRHHISAFIQTHIYTTELRMHITIPITYINPTEVSHLLSFKHTT